MAFESKFQSRVPDDSMPDSYYQKGVNGFLSQMGLSLHSAANWRFFAISMLCVNVFAVGMVSYLGVRSTIVPYIVEVKPALYLKIWYFMNLIGTKRILF